MVEMVGMYIIGEICKQVLLIFRWMSLLHVHGVVNCHLWWDSWWASEKVKFCDDKKGPGFESSGVQVKPPPGPPPPFCQWAWLWGWQWLVRSGLPFFFSCFIFWKRKSCDDNIGYLNTGYKVTQLVIFVSNFRCFVIG